MTSHHQFSLRGTITRQRFTIFVYDLNFDAESASPLFCKESLLIFCSPATGLWRQRSHRANCCGFGHSPAMAHLHMIGINAFGIAEPPTPVLRMLVNRRSCCSMYDNSAYHMVGTPALTVTSSDSISS